MSVHLHIDRVIVDRGVLGGAHTRDFGDALQHELARLFATPDAVAALAGLGAVDALSPLAMAPARPGQEGVAARIAATVGNGLGLPGSTGRARP